MKSSTKSVSAHSYHLSMISAPYRFSYCWRPACKSQGFPAPRGRTLTERRCRTVAASRRAGTVVLQDSSTSGIRGARWHSPCRADLVPLERQRDRARDPAESPKGPIAEGTTESGTDHPSTTANPTGAVLAGYTTFAAIFPLFQSPPAGRGRGKPVPAAKWPPCAAALPVPPACSCVRAVLC